MNVIPVMKKFYLFLLILIIFFFQFSILGVFFEGGRSPNLFVALTAGLVLFFGFERSLIWTALAGLLLDIGSSWPIGLGALGLVIVLWLIDKIKDIAEFRSKRYLFAFFLFLTAGTASVFFDFFLNYFFRIEKIFFPNVSVQLFFPSFGKDYVLKTIYTAASAIVVYFFVRKIPRKSETFSLRNR